MQFCGAADKDLGLPRAAPPFLNWQAALPIPPTQWGRSEALGWPLGRSQREWRKFGLGQRARALSLSFRSGDEVRSDQGEGEEDRGLGPGKAECGAASHGLLVGESAESPLSESWGHIN